MKVPYAVQGAFFAPALVGLIFIIKISCPAGAGQGCFADPFMTPLFMPLSAIYRVLGNVSFVVQYEPLFVLLYWIIVGFFVGLIFDILKHKI